MTISLLPEDASDKELTRKVSPNCADYPNRHNRYDLIVVGGGTAGLVAAAGAAGLGARVALIERDLLGGDCLNAGCVPSKALLASAHVAALSRGATTYGLHQPAGEVHFPEVMQRLRGLRASLADNDSVERFTGLGVHLFGGTAHFVGADCLEVQGQRLNFSRAIVATGTRPAVPAIPGLAEAGFYTNESIFTLTTLPPRLVVLGGGPIGCELAQAFARLGSQVTLLQRDDRLLPRDDAEAASLVQESLQRDGVEILTRCTVAQVQRREQETVLTTHTAQAGAREVVADALLVATGRQPNVEALDLQAAGIAFDGHGVQVNDHLRTTNRRVYAAGDICSRFRFTHAADAMARIAVQNALFLGRARASALVIPWCTYTSPELAQVGLTEEEARQQRIPVQIFRLAMAHVDRAVLDGETEGFVKLLVRAGTDRILGATLVGSRAGDLVGEITLAMTHGLGLRQFASTIHPYPTRAEVLRKLGDAYNRTRLTPWVRWLLNGWLRLRRLIP